MSRDSYSQSITRTLFRSFEFDLSDVCCKTRFSFSSDVMFFNLYKVSGTGFESDNRKKWLKSGLTHFFNIFVAV